MATTTTRYRSMLALIMMFMVCAISVNAAEFRDFPSEPPLRWTAIAPKINTPKARTYCGQLKSQSKKGPNFNGHYRLVSWGCGTSCLAWAVVDLSNGNVWIAPVNYCASPRMDKEGMPIWIESRIDSSLVCLYECQMSEATSCPEDRPNRRHSYVWSRGRMKSLGVECVPN
jgi:hypothetical protein